MVVVQNRQVVHPTYTSTHMKCGIFANPPAPLLRDISLTSEITNTQAAATNSWRLRASTGKQMEATRACKTNLFQPPSTSNPIQTKQFFPHKLQDVHKKESIVKGNSASLSTTSTPTRRIQRRSPIVSFVFGQKLEPAYQVTPRSLHLGGRGGYVV